MIVPNRWPRRHDQSSMPMTRGAEATGRRAPRMQFSSVSGLKASPRAARIRAPPSPPSARALASTTADRRVVRRA